MLTICGLSMVVEPAFAQTWTLSGAPATHDWWCVASSADGSKLVAGGSLFSEGRLHFLIYTSTNSGATWTSNNISTILAPWTSAASSADGTKLAVAGGVGAQYGVIFTSTDAGATWVSTSATNETWISVASSADGNKLIAAAGASDYVGLGVSSAICISTNGGVTWTQSSAPSNY